MVRELQIHPAAMDIDERLLKYVMDHDDTFRMPARASLGPWRIPANAFLGRLPQSEIQRVLLLAVFIDPGTDHQIIDALM